MPTWWEELLHLATGRESRHTGLPDLRDLPARRVTVERTHYLVNDRERRDQRRRLYVLRREPGSYRSEASIAVFSNGRSVGYLPDRISREIAPLIDELGGAVVVNGAGALHGSIRLRVDVPTREAVHGFVRTRGAVADAAAEGSAPDA